MMQAAAHAIGLNIQVLHASAENEFDSVFATLNQLRVRALVVSPDTLFVARSERLAALALHYGVPTILPGRDFAANGGLVSYGGNVIELAHKVGLYAGRILNGEKPADLPVEQTTIVELVVNLKTAKMLGVAVPSSLLGRADEVIE
jgi:putative ABC transport system substrate-binding protein